MSFIDLEDIASNVANKPETVGTEKREVTNEELAEVMVSQAAKFVARKKPTDESTASARASYNLAMACSKDNGFKVIERNIKTLFAKHAEANQKDDDELHATIRQSSQFLLVFIRRIQSQIARQGYFLERHAEACEQAAVDKSKEPVNNYDGFKYMVINQDQVREVTESVYENLLQAYGYLLSLGDRWTREQFGDFPYASAMIGDDFVDLETREQLFEVLNNNRPAMSDSKKAIGLLA